MIEAVLGPHDLPFRGQAEMHPKGRSIRMIVVARF
jgi:hypothetical protein